MGRISPQLCGPLVKFTHLLEVKHEIALNSAWNLKLALHNLAIRHKISRQNLTMGHRYLPPFTSEGYGIQRKREGRVVRPASPLCQPSKTRLPYQRTQG